jgi:hypothetical protein
MKNSLLQKATAATQVYFKWQVVFFAGLPIPMKYSTG